MRSVRPEGAEDLWPQVSVDRADNFDAPRVEVREVGFRPLLQI